MAPNSMPSQLGLFLTFCEMRCHCRIKCWDTPFPLKHKPRTFFKRDWNARTSQSFVNVTQDPPSHKNVKEIPCLHVTVRIRNHWTMCSSVARLWHRKANNIIRETFTEHFWKQSIKSKLSLEAYHSDSETKLSMKLILNLQKIKKVGRHIRERNTRPACVDNSGTYIDTSGGAQLKYKQKGWISCSETKTQCKMVYKDKDKH